MSSANGRPRGRPRLRLADQILKSAPQRRETVEIPEWKVNGKPVKLLVRPMTAREQIALAQGGELDAQEAGLIGLLQCVRDPKTDEPAFTRDELDRLLDGDAPPIIRLLQRVNAINGFGIEAAEKNS